MLECPTCAERPRLAATDVEGSPPLCCCPRDSLCESMCLPYNSKSMSSDTSFQRAVDCSPQKECMLIHETGCISNLPAINLTTKLGRRVVCRGMHPYFECIMHEVGGRLLLPEGRMHWCSILTLQARRLTQCRSASRCSTEFGSFTALCSQSHSRQLTAFKSNFSIRTCLCARACHAARVFPERRTRVCAVPLSKAVSEGGADMQQRIAPRNATPLDAMGPGTLGRGCVDLLIALLLKPVSWQLQVTLAWRDGGIDAGIEHSNCYFGSHFSFAGLQAHQAGIRVRAAMERAAPHSICTKKSEPNSELAPAWTEIVAIGAFGLRSWSPPSIKIE
eukprot:1161535-Pelagomonas_calceolata.AAC.3